MHRTPPPSRGFTLLELMVILTIIGILAAVVIPSIASRSQPFEIAEQSRRLHTEVSKLRARSVAEARQFNLVVEGGNVVRVEQGTGDDRVVLRTETMPDGASAALNGSSSGTLTFYPTGRVSGAGNLVIEDATSRHTVRVLASGMTRLITETVE